MSRRTLEIRLLDTWHVGTGQGRGSHLDAIVARDVDGLPYVPGRMLRGLLRDAVDALEQWGHVSAGTARRIFGSESQDASSASGCIGVSDALLPEAERELLGHPQQGALRAGLFLSSYQTAIELASGTADAGSLRGVELVVPLTLHAQIELTGQAASTAWDTLTQALPLVRAIGAMKTRGHGRAALAWAGEKR